MFYLEHMIDSLQNKRIILEDMVLYFSSRSQLREIDRTPFQNTFRLQIFARRDNFNQLITLLVL